MRKITLLKSGNRLVISPTTPRIHDLLAPLLTFTSKEFLRGWERRQAVDNDEPTVILTDHLCYDEDHKGRLSTSFGFWKRIWDTLKKKGYKPVMRDLTPHPNPEVFQPHWDRLKQYDIKLRPGQKEFLLKVFSHRCGRFDCYTGFGKSFMIGVVGLLLPKARIDVTSKRVTVVRDRIFPELAQMLPDVGIVGGGRKKKGCRVMCYTADSLHHAHGDADIFFGDECHELAADEVARKSARYDSSRNFGLSASHDMRLDNKDLRVEAIFGPMLAKFEYQSGVDAGNVVPMEVHWRPVVMDYNPCEDEYDTEKKRLGIWTNDYRNDLIAKDARLYDDDTQVLITVESIEHAVHLKKRLPEFQLAYREDGMSDSDRRYYVKNHLLDRHEPIMDRARRGHLTKAFEEGSLKKAICTSIWNVGFSPNGLEVLIRGDAGGSPIMDTQIPGRACRKIAGKDVSIIHDYMDQFDRGFRQKAGRRRRSYEAHGWEQVYPDKPPKGSLLEQLHWEFEEDDDE